MTNEFTGRAKGGKARAAALTPEERSAAARKAVEARWNDPVLQATHGSQDHPLRIGNVEIPCYVLEGDIRVISQRGIFAGVGLARGGTGGAGTDRLLAFFENFSNTSYVSEELMAVLRNPIRFKSPVGGGVIYGYPATILADICDTILAIRKGGDLPKRHQNLAQQCEILMRGFARVGIIALVDEATGYQADRAKDALSRILEVFIAKELQPYLPTFPTDFYKELFRLRGLKFAESSVKRPQYFGVLTNDIVYKRLAPGVLEELKKVSEKRADGSLKHKLFQRLTANKGYPTLRGRLDAIVAIMKLSKNYSDFIDKMNVVFPKYGQLSLALEYEEKDDTGEGI